MGAGRTAVRHLDHLVSGRRRFLYRLHRDRGDGAWLCVGAYGFCALPHTVIVYPFVFVVMPVLWKAAHAKGHVTAADVVHGIYNSRGLELAVATTGMVATMPYIALQLIGMGVVIK